MTTRAENKKLLEVKGLKTCFQVEDKFAKAVDGVSLDIRSGEFLTSL
jgi:ABC-type oligopeptide transport system ATPase subunit